MTSHAIAATATSRSASRQRWIIATSTLWAGALIALHVPLGLAMHRFSLLATVHALAAVGIALLLALGSNPVRVVYAAAYIAGAEVLWRLCDAQVFWEIGKYGIAAAFLLALVRMQGMRWRVLPLLYLLALLPASLLTFGDFPFGEARQYVSFNLSGPLVLGVSAWYLSHVRIGRVELQRTFLLILAPVVGVVAITLFSTYTATEISFATDSNFVTSGGFGPNQVSAILGLGALLAFFLAIDRRAGPAFRVIMLSAMVAAAAQSAMTFSRGGLYGAGGAALLGSFFLLQDARSRLALLLSGLLAFGVANYVLIPRLNQFTEGALAARFQELDTTNRTTILQEDLHLFLKHPVFGVGPGGAKARREMSPVAAHTEYTRLLAEHGLLGVTACALLLAMALYRMRAAQSPQARALAAAMLAWSLLFMLHSGMRLAAPGFLFGLASARGLALATRSMRRRSPAVTPQFTPALLASPRDAV